MCLYEASLASVNFLSRMHVPLVFEYQNNCVIWIHIERSH